MPLIKLQTSVPVPADKKTALLGALSKIAAEGIGKPEQYVMVSIDDGPIMMSGIEGPAALVEIRSIGGLNSRVNNDIAKRLSSALKTHLGIPADRIYAVFIEVDAENWAWNSKTFS